LAVGSSEMSRVTPPNETVPNDNPALRKRDARAGDLVGTALNVTKPVSLLAPPYSRLAL